MNPLKGITYYILTIIRGKYGKFILYGGE